MSNSSIRIIPEDPEHVPDATRQARARSRLAEIAPAADHVRGTVSDAVQFVDCGGSFERIRCPFCATEIPVDWWQARMDGDYTDGSFRLEAYTTPCCARTHRLQELVYEPPMGFSRYVLEAQNPNLLLEDHHRTELEQILGTKIRVIYALY